MRGRGGEGLTDFAGAPWRWGGGKRVERLIEVHGDARQCIGAYAGATFPFDYGGRTDLRDFRELFAVDPMLLHEARNGRPESWWLTRVHFAVDRMHRSALSLRRSNEQAHKTGRAGE